MYHTVILVGNVGRDPEMRYTPSGQAVTSFSVAVSDGFGEKKKTVWFRVSAWEKTAEACNNYLHKGSRVLVEGRLNADEKGGPRIWNRQDGTPAASFEITASVVRFLTSKGEGGQAGAAEEGSFAAPAGSEDDIPF